MKRLKKPETGSRVRAEVRGVQCIFSCLFPLLPTFPGFRFLVSWSFFAVVLSGCSVPTIPTTGSGSLTDLLHTASGFVLKATKEVQATVELGQLGLEKAKSTVTDVQKRVGQVESGITALKKGRDELQKAVR